MNYNRDLNRENAFLRGGVEEYGGANFNLVSDKTSEIRDSRPDGFNLSTGSVRLTSGMRGNKYAQIDHFAHQEDLQQSLNHSLQAKEQKMIQSLVSNKKDKVEDNREIQLIREQIELREKEQEEDKQQKIQLTLPNFED